MSDMISIDGSQGEGGGQIVRSSLALAMISGKGVAIERLRAGREKPGLMRQHLTAVRAAAEICQADVAGDEIGSAFLRFQPGSVVPGEYKFSIGTAGSATLVLQTVLPPLLLASGPSRLILEGGTHNPWAPPFDFIQQTYLPLVNRMGPNVTATLERPGFYPAGGGRFVVEIEPCPQLRGFTLLDRGAIQKRRGRVMLSNLPGHIAQREVDELRRLTGWDADCITTEDLFSQGPGNVVLLELEYEQITEVFIGFGEYGVKAEEVARRATKSMRNYLSSDVPVGPHLADQLLLLLGISAWQKAGGGTFHTSTLTRHSLTQIDVLRNCLGVRTSITPAKTGNAANVIIQVGDSDLDAAAI